MDNIANNLGALAFTMLLIYTIYDRFFSKRAKEQSTADDRLTKIFEDTIKALEIKLNNLSLELDKTNVELQKIKSEYDVVVKILQGRDDGIIAYQKRGLEVMNKVDNTILPLLQEIKILVKKK